MSFEIPGYSIIRTLGKGGMATVFLARQEIFEREVALKVMSKALAEDESFGQRFFREAKIVSQLVHPNIVTVHDVGVHDGYYYLSMEHIDGGDLKQARHSFSLKQKIRAVIDIAKALDYAGAKGYVHRDIKPENIMFHRSDGRAVLTDFGIARAAETDTSMTQTGTAIGTPHYMSPEQAKGKSVDHRSDLYSLGVVFFLLLSGRVPYDAESAVAIGIKHITEPVPLLPVGMDALQPLIDTLLAKKPEARYQTAREFIREIERIDLDLLQQTVEFAVETQAENVDRETPTIPPMRVDESDMLYRPGEPILAERPTLWPWFIGFIIVLSLAAWLLYQQKPEPLKSWLENTASWLNTSLDRGRQWLDKGSPDDQREGPRANGEVPPDTLEPAVKTSPQPIATPEPDPRPDDRADANTTIGSGRIDRKQARPQPLVAPTPQPTPVAPTPPPVPGVAEYQAKIETVRKLYSNDPAYLSELVEAHQALLADYPDHAGALRSLDRLRENELGKARQLAQAGKLSAALKKIDQLRVLFPASKQTEFDRLQADIEQQQTRQQLLAQAREYMDARQLTRPSGRNALASYRQLLALDPKNQQARQGIREIADILAGEAEDLFRSGSNQSALNTANKALSIVDGHPQATALKRRINRQMAYQREMEDYFRLAELRSARAEYFTPEGDCANYYYQRILQREPKNARARLGQEQLVDDFSRSIWKLVGNEDFAAARSQLSAARKALPRNPRIASLAAAVEEVIADKQ